MSVVHRSICGTPDYDVLAAASGIEDGCIRVNALATLMMWSKSRLSRQLGRMEQRGLIAREPCDLDGRGDDVVVTPDGRAALRRARSRYTRSVRTYFADRLSDAQLTALADAAETVLRHLDEEEFALGELRRSLDRPTHEELLERVRSRTASAVAESAADAVRAERDVR